MKRVVVLAAAGLAVSMALAQTGPGMMGPGTMGYCMGPGMMHGYGMGPGMMGPGMMGPGMMGPGMMGPGMMGGYGYGNMPDLSPEQRAKMLEIQQRVSQQHWDIMGKMHQQGYGANDPYRAGKLDEQTARKNFETMTGFHRQMFESWLQAQKEMDALLTPEQRQQMQRR